MLVDVVELVVEVGRTVVEVVVDGSVVVVVLDVVVLVEVDVVVVVGGKVDVLVVVVDLRGTVVVVDGTVVVVVVVVGGGVGVNGAKITIGRYRCGLVQASRCMLRALFDTVICTDPNASRQGSGWAW